MLKLRIYYEDTDCGGVVYYANYLRYFERARTEFFRARGFELSDFSGQGILFVVGHVDITYHHPARYNDLLEIKTEISDVGRASFSLSHQINTEPSNQTIVTGKVKMVCIDENEKPRRLPDEVAHVLKKAHQGKSPQ